MKLSKRAKTIATILLFAAICGAAITYGVVRTARFPHWLTDDAFIIFRYAENLAEKGELNWNPGEDPVEGYTGITLVTIIAAAIKLGISPITASHVIGILCFFLAGGLILLILRGFNIGSSVALALYFTTPFLFMHAWSGLETTMFTTCILFALYTYTVRREALFATSLLLLSLTRPEGIFLSALLLVCYRPLSRIVLMVYVVPFLVYFVWRWIYYGQLLPNTYYTKSSSLTPIDANIESFRLLLRNYVRYPALLTLIFVSFDQIRKQKRLIIALATFSVVSLYVYLSSDLVMNFAYRFFVPFYVLTLLAMGAALRGPKLGFRVILFTAFMLAVQVSFNADRLEPIRSEAKSYYGCLRKCHIEIGKYLRSHIPVDEWLVVHADAGAIPYYSKLRTLDFGRLNDEYLARNFSISWEAVRQPAENDTIPETQTSETAKIQDLVNYYYSVRPGALAFTSYNRSELSHGTEVNWITQDVRFNNYTLIKKYHYSDRRKYYQFLYIRNDLLDLVEVDRTGDQKRAATILARMKKEGRTDSARGGRSRSSPTGKTSRALEAGAAALLPRAATLSADSLWLLAGEERDPRIKIEWYRALLEHHGDDRNAPAACFMIGFVYAEELLDTLEATKAFEQVIERFPDSEIADSAEYMLGSLGNPRSERLDEPIRR